MAAPQQPGAGAIGPTPPGITDVTAETLPLTGIEVLPLAALGSGLMAAGAASLKIAKQVDAPQRVVEDAPAALDDADWTSG